jgi:hypothetical protein
MSLQPLETITGSLFPSLEQAPSPARASNSPRREAGWRADLTRAWSYWRGKAKDEAEGARIDAAFEEQLAEGPDFARYHRGSEFKDAPSVTLDGNACAKLMAAWRSIERGSWKAKEKGKHGGVIGKTGLRVLETFLFVLYRPGKPICVPYEAIASAAMCSRRAVATALQWLQHMGLITVHRRIKRIKTPLGFKVVQDVNAYELHEPRGLGSIAARLFGGLAAMFSSEGSECRNSPAKGTHLLSLISKPQKLGPPSPKNDAWMPFEIKGGLS